MHSRPLVPLPRPAPALRRSRLTTTHNTHLQRQLQRKTFSSQSPAMLIEDDQERSQGTKARRRLKRGERRCVKQHHSPFRRMYRAAALAYQYIVTHHHEFVAEYHAFHEGGVALPMRRTRLDI